MIKKHPPDHLSERLRPHEIPYPTLSRDTDPKAEAVQIEIYRRMPAWRKVELVADAIETSRLLALAGLRGRFPEAGEEEEYWAEELELADLLERALAEA